jgi:polysaccharide pyruvyl transferase WcaK-like protein
VIPLFICNDVSDGSTYDMAASMVVRNSMRNAKRTFVVPNHYWAPQQVLSLIACCRTTISTRYHFCLFSALQKTPFIALQRSDKVQDLCVDLQWPYGIHTQSVSASRLLALYDEIERERPRWNALLESGVGSMHRRALRSQDVLDSLLDVAASSSDCVSGNTPTPTG